MAITQKERHYPQLPKEHESLQPAFNELHTHLYELRDELQKMQGGKDSAKVEKSKFTGDIQGIGIKAVTDSSSLQNGYTIRYNAATGQFEFGM